jgi:hypothetical protein
MHAARLSLLSIAAVTVAVATVAGPASADTATFGSVADNTIIQDPTGAYSAGAAQYFFSGRVGNNGGATLRRGALRFNLSTIPPGSTITSVTLRLYCSAAGATTAQSIRLHRFTNSWGEGTSVAFGGGGADSTSNDVTWLHRFFPGQPWATPGGEYLATASASRSVGGIGTYTWASSAGLVADVTAWVNSPASNHGWCVIGNETTLQSVKRFDSRESGSSTARPLLTVVYTPPSSNPYDLNNDGVVNAADLATLLSQWGGPGTADFNNSGTVDAADLASLLGAWTT